MIFLVGARIGIGGERPDPLANRRERRKRGIPDVAAAGPGSQSGPAAGDSERHLGISAQSLVSEARMGIISSTSTDSASVERVEGSHTVKTEPPPGPLSTVIFPLCRSMISLQIASPKTSARHIAASGNFSAIKALK